MCCDDSCSDNCRVFCFVCNITSFKNAAKDSLPCPDNTNKFILFWVKCLYIINNIHPSRGEGSMKRTSSTEPCRSPSSTRRVLYSESGPLHEPIWLFRSVILSMNLLLEFRSSSLTWLLCLSWT